MYQTLVVDDEENIRSFIGKSLELVGHKIEFAKNGEEALEILRDQNFDLAVLDLNLGGKVDGLKVLEAVRWRWPEMAVVILTGHGSLESAMAAIRDGVDRYLLKPVDPQEIRKAAEEAIEKRRQYFDLKRKGSGTGRAGSWTGVHSQRKVDNPRERGRSIPDQP